MVEMTMMLKRPITMALETSNKDEFLWQKYELTIFDDIKSFPYGSPREKFTICLISGFASISENNQGDYSIKKIHVHATFRFSTLWPLDFCKVCVHIQWGVENFILFLGCFHKKRELPINWKHTVRESFSGPIKIDVTFLGFLLGNFNMREVGHHQK